jgi:hypothetical protein
LSPFVRFPGGQSVSNWHANAKGHKNSPAVGTDIVSRLSNFSIAAIYLANQTRPGAVADSHWHNTQDSRLSLHGNFSVSERQKRKTTHRVHYAGRFAL